MAMQMQTNLMHFYLREEMSYLGASIPHTMAFCMYCITGVYYMFLTVETPPALIVHGLHGVAARPWFSF